MTRVKEWLLMKCVVRPTFNSVQKSLSLARLLLLCPGIISQQKIAGHFKRDLLLSTGYLELAATLHCNIGWLVWPSCPPAHYQLESNSTQQSLETTEVGFHGVASHQLEVDLTVCKEIKARFNYKSMFVPPKEFLPWPARSTTR